MPFKSQAQRAWMYANKPAMAKRWEKHTPRGKKLPKRITVNARYSRIDPTRTLTLRRAFSTAMSKRFAVLRRELLKLILQEDALGLKESKVTWNHEYASTQVNLNEKEIEQRIRYVQTLLDPKDVLKLDNQPHVTIRYGLHDEDPEAIRALIAGSGPIWIKLGRLSLFTSEKQDVLKIEATSSRLDELNRRVALVPNTQTFSEYTPHLTVAYLKPGTGSKYLPILTGLEGKEIIATRVAFSDKERNHTEIILNTRWKYQTNMQKLAAFRLWLQDLMKGAVTNGDWWTAYVEDGYRKGAQRALQDVMKAMPDVDKPLGPFYGGTQRQFMESSFGRVVPVEKVQMLATRVFSDLDGVTDYMETNIVRSLTDGLTQGMAPKAIAANMVKTVNIGLNRAKSIAQTEIIRSHAEGQLDSLERLGVSHVGVTVEWSVAGDNHVCKLCRPLKGIVLTIDEMRGMIPRHPNCRCAIKPAGMIDRRGTQVKTKNRIDAAIAKSLGNERKGTKSNWAGAKLKVAKKRPQTVMG